MISITAFLYDIGAKVRKGDIRNTVLRQINFLQTSSELLNQGKSIKEQEVQEFKEKNPEKTKKLRAQILIIKNGIKHINKAIEKLQEYKNIVVT